MATNTGYWWATGGSPTPVQTQQAPTIPDRRTELTGLIKQATDEYNKLIASGREADAFALADAMRRIQAAGASTGVSSWARQQAINDVRDRMASAARQRNAEIVSQGIDKQRALLGDIRAEDEAAYNRWLSATNQAQQAEQMARSAWTQQQQDQERKIKEAQQYALERQKMAAATAASREAAAAARRPASQPLSTMGTSSRPASPLVFNALAARNPYEQSVALPPGSKWGWTSGLPARS